MLTDVLSMACLHVAILVPKHGTPASAGHGTRVPPTLFLFVGRGGFLGRRSQPASNWLSVEAESRLTRGHNGLGAMLNAEFCENARDVIAHRFLRDLQPLRDFDIGEAARNAVQELLFTFRQIGQLAAWYRTHLLVGIEEVVEL